MMHIIRRFVAAVPLVSLATALSAQRPAQGAPQSSLESAFAFADSATNAWVAAKRIPGAVLVVAQNGKVLHEKAYGYAQEFDFNVKPLANPRAMRTSTIFDLASVTKVMATTFGVMLLVDRGKLDVDAPVYRYLPDFRGPHLDSITVRQLLTHTAGLVQWQPLYYHASTKAQTYDVIRKMPLQWGVGEGYHYSDLGFMLLGYIVERVSGLPLDEFVAQQLYRPLGLTSTTFNPKKHGLAGFAATEAGNGYEKHMVYDSTFHYTYRGDPKAWNGWRQYVLDGETNDGNSWYANGGVAGHAGLFSTAPELRVLVDLLVNRGTYGGHQYISPRVVEQFIPTDPSKKPLGWMEPRDMPPGTFSHNGFTGTYVLGVPAAKLSMVLLINRQNVGTDARGNFINEAPLRQAIAKAIVVAALPASRPAVPPP
jgi:CubicO group peptidase (beta-lactamase class C family)